ncbi:MAG: metal-binding protein [Aquificaceae bacterium]|nr:DUF2227 family putative metal-binding protein [Aquificaceae bacterium]MDW8422868.1 metal-binding protein [Aquificaceae bacterium]
MALGRSHDFFNLLALPFCLYYTPREFYIPFIGGYLFGTFFLSPDLDLPKSKPSKRWKVFKLLWRPYHALSKHRGISHIPLVGTLVRVGYLVLTSVFLYFVLLGFSSKYAPWLKELLLSVDPFELFSSLAGKEEVFYFALGVVASEVFHLILDFLTSSLRRFKI